MDDNAIVELFFVRSEQAIRELDDKYGKICHSLSYGILQSHQDAEECVNDAYLGTWNAIPPTRPNPLLAFLCKIVRNLSLTRYHANRAAKRTDCYTLTLDELRECLASPQATEDVVEDIVKEQELVQSIEDFLDTLSPENRVILLRRYWFSDSRREIAKRTGLSENNVAVRLTRIRKQLRHYLEERGII